MLFCSSLKLLLNKRKTVSSVTPLLAFAGVLAALITWVSSRCRHYLGRPLLTGPIVPRRPFLTACSHGCGPVSLRFQA